MEMTRDEMWKEFEDQLIRETRTSITMSYDASERITKRAIKECVPKWKDRLGQNPRKVRYEGDEYSDGEWIVDRAKKEKKRVNERTEYHKCKVGNNRRYFDRFG